MLHKPSIQGSKKSSGFSPGAREVSACRHTIKKLQNRLADVQRELEDSRKENRILNRLRIRHEKELNQYQSQEGELPQMLARHSEEVCELCGICPLGRL